MARIAESDEFYEEIIPKGISRDERLICRQGYAGLLWTKQFFHYVIENWLQGDNGAPPSPARLHGRNADWQHFFARDILSMPDKWEYPWFAAWDTAFHMIPFAALDPDFTKHQLLLLLREWYMHPNGQLPAYEWIFSDVNPPVHAWAVWRVYKIADPKGQRDLLFLERAFQKLLLNFTWWVNRKGVEGRHVFGGGFLGLDNIGVFDRSHALPGGGHLNQADGTAWMASFCLTMLAMALELALEKPAYEDIASKFFEHFVNICDAINSLGGTGLWDSEDGFYYNQLIINHREPIPLGIRSLVGLLDPKEFLSNFGIRSLSKAHEAKPFVFEHAGQRHEIPTPRARRPPTCSAATPTGRTCCYSTNISTRKPAKVSVLPTKPAGPRWSSASSANAARNSCIPSPRAPPTTRELPGQSMSHRLRRM